MQIYCDHIELIHSSKMTVCILTIADLNDTAGSILGLTVVSARAPPRARHFTCLCLTILSRTIFFY